MLYVFYGSNYKKLRAKLARFRETLHVKRPEAEFFKIDDPGDVTVSSLEGFVSGQGLFDRKYIVQLDRVLEDTSARESIVEQLENVRLSDNVFLLVEGMVDARIRKAIETYATESYVFNNEEIKKDVFNIFSLTDELGKRNKKRLWIEFWKARYAGKEAEEIHGVLFWQIKSMLLAKCYSSAHDAGMKPFPYKKASGFANNFTYDELIDLSRRFVYSYHEARYGNGDVAGNLEQIILSI